MAGSRMIVFVGPGVMAEAIAAGLIERAGWPPEAIVMSGPRPERLRDLATRLGVRTQEDSRQTAAEANVIVLSVKPQTLPEVVGGLAGGIPPGALVLSIVAGARLADLTRRLQPAAIVRAMPNTPPRSARVSRSGRRHLRRTSPSGGRA